MDGRHLSQLLDEAVARRPDHPAVEDEHGLQLSYAALGRGADRLATRLARWGVGRGDRVGLWLPKGLEAVTAIHGILRYGRRLRAGRSDRARGSGREYPGSQRRQGRRGRRRAGTRSPPGMGRSGSPAPFDRGRRQAGLRLRGRAIELDAAR